jgi:hypothetical protein
MDRFAAMLEYAARHPDVIAELSQPTQRPRPVNSPTLNFYLREAFGLKSMSKDAHTRQILFEAWERLVANSPRCSETKQDSVSNMWIRRFKALDSILKLMYREQETLLSHLGKFRKVIKNRFGARSELYRQCIWSTGISREESLARRATYMENVIDKGMKRGDMEPIYSDDIKALMAECCTSKKAIDRCIAIMLATASRYSECVLVSQYMPVPGIDPHEAERYVLIRGIAKCKDPNSKSIIRPLVFMSLTELLGHVAYVRARIKTPNTFPINLRLKRVVLRGKPLTSHKLRYISANLAYLLHGNGATPGIWIQRHLGHESGETTRIYQSINVQLGANPTQSQQQASSERGHAHDGRLQLVEKDERAPCRGCPVRRNSI